MPEPEHFDLPVPVAPPPAATPLSAGATVFWSALGGLVSLGTGLATTRADRGAVRARRWLGRSARCWPRSRCSRCSSFARREIAGLFRLASIEKLRARAEAALAERRPRRGARDRARTDRQARRNAAARARRGELEAHLTEIIDGRDLLHIAERAPDGAARREAAQLVARTATRVSVVTAVSPRAAVDIAFVLFAALGMIRRLAALYGGRPGMLGLIRLVRHIIAHLPSPAGSRPATA